MNRKELDIHPSTFAGEYRLQTNDLSMEKARDAVVDMIGEICRVLRNRGCRLIGHIKALLYTTSCGSQFFSITSFDECVRCKGHIDNDAREIKMIINVIVFDIDDGDLRTLCNDAVGKFPIFTNTPCGSDGKNDDRCAQRA